MHSKGASQQTWRCSCAATHLVASLRCGHPRKQAAQAIMLGTRCDPRKRPEAPLISEAFLIPGHMEDMNIVKVVSVGGIQQYQWASGTRSSLKCVLTP